MEKQQSDNPHLIPTLMIYTVIRVGLVAVLTLGITEITRLVAGVPMPLLVALAFAMVLQLPLSIVFFRKQRDNVTGALARAKASRNSEHDRLRAALSGDLDSDSAPEQ